MVLSALDFEATGWYVNLIMKTSIHLSHEGLIFFLKSLSNALFILIFT